MVAKKTAKKVGRKSKVKIANTRTASVRGKASESPKFSEKKAEQFKPQYRKYVPTSGVAVLGLIINLFIPGLGTIIGGKNYKGFCQLLLFFASLIVSVFISGIGVLFFAIAWIWALVSSIQILKRSR